MDFIYLSSRKLFFFFFLSHELTFARNNETVLDVTRVRKTEARSKEETRDRVRVTFVTIVFRLDHCDPFFFIRLDSYGTSNERNSRHVVITQSELVCDFCHPSFLLILKKRRDFYRLHAFFV